jgi:hypothetical protein
MIGYYAHHQGEGHTQRMRAIAEHLSESVTGLSSAPPPTGWTAPWVQLAADDAPGPVVDPTALGTLHWVPRGRSAMRDRAAALCEWISRTAPDLVVVDTSVEVAVQVRLTGTPVVAMAMPGHRLDRAHRLAYDLADVLIAPWPADVAGDCWPDSWRDKAVHVGGLSRFDGRSSPCVRGGDGPRRALFLWGSGGRIPSTHDLQALELATPGYTWQFAIAGRHDALGEEEMWEALCRADVVVSHGGQNAVAEIAAARTPAVLVADERPFDEQRHTVGAIVGAGIALGLFAWPEPERWSKLLDEACLRGGEHWKRWSDGRGACRTAATLDRLAHDMARAS